MQHTHEMEDHYAGKSLQEFCDMNQLYRLLDNWSKSCGMATVIVDTEGNQVSEDFGMTEFCRLVQSCEKGMACCRATWKAELTASMNAPSASGISPFRLFCRTGRCLERCWPDRLCLSFSGMKVSCKRQKRWAWRKEP